LWSLGKRKTVRTHERMGTAERERNIHRTELQTGFSEDAVPANPVFGAR
jgi:hypothetical protein